MPIILYTLGTRSKVFVYCLLSTSRGYERARVALKSDKSQLLCADKPAVVATDAFIPRRHNARIPKSFTYVSHSFAFPLTSAPSALQPG